MQGLDMTYHLRDCKWAQEGRERVILNVGGKRFITYKETLQRYPDTLLGRMFSSSAVMAHPDCNGEYFFDRNARFFSFILNWYQILLVSFQFRPLPHIFNSHSSTIHDFSPRRFPTNPHPIPFPPFFSLLIALLSRSLIRSQPQLGIVQGCFLLPRMFPSRPCMGNYAFGEWMIQPLKESLGGSSSSRRHARIIPPRVE